MRVGVLVFPGSNCDQDTARALAGSTRAHVDLIWHRDSFPPGYDLLVLPGGFSYGDYLRTGAIAACSPALARVKEHAVRGGLVLGICNGFQILTEAGLLPGALTVNKDLAFICRDVTLRVETDETPFTSLLAPGRVVTLPIAHGQGCYVAEAQTLRMLEDEGRIVLRYSGPAGEIDPRWNPNGSLGSIAGIVNAHRNIMGLMPHPERNADPLLGSGDGVAFFQSIARWIGARAEAA